MAAQYVTLPDVLVMYVESKTVLPVRQKRSARLRIRLPV